MSKIEAMMKSRRYNHHPFTEEGVLARLTETGLKYQPRILATSFSTSCREMRAILDKLAAAGLIQVGTESTNKVFFIPKRQQPASTPEGVATYREQATFRPLVGYEARMREFADRRSA